MTTIVRSRTVPRIGSPGDFSAAARTDRWEYVKIPADGAFGPVTEAAVRGFQNSHAEYTLYPSGEFSLATDAATRGFQRGTALAVDGMVGKQTWGTLFGGRI